MISWNILFTIIAGLILFLYGIEHFSNEILAVAKGKFNLMLGKFTTNPLKAALLGAFITALVQSSTATTVITVGLVNAGILSFAQSLGIIIGSNIGTTLTAQLVAYDLISFGPVFIVLGFVIGIVGRQYRFLGKPLFYFGLVFFSLSLLSGALEPFKNDPAVISWISQFSVFPVALLVGLAFTAIVQSSAVTTGIAVILAHAGLIGLPEGILLLLGANIGTTMTSLLASARMDLFAKRAAIAHLVFNAGGVLLLLPFFESFVMLISSLGGTVAAQVANAHLIFNAIIAVIFLLFIGQFRAAVVRLVPGDEEEIILKPKYLNGELPEDTGDCFELIGKELLHLYDVTHDLFTEGSRLLEGDHRNYQKILKLKALNEMLDDRIESAIFTVSRRKLETDEARKTVLFLRMSNLLFRLSDWGQDFGMTMDSIRQSRMPLPPEQVREIREAHATLEKNFTALRKDFPEISEETSREIKRNDRELREKLNVFYQMHLKRISQESEGSDSKLIEILSIIERSNGNLHMLRKMGDIYSGLEKADLDLDLFSLENSESYVPE